jgi:penicillin-binding protein 1A
MPTTAETTRRKLPRWLFVLYGFFVICFVLGGAALGTLAGYQYNLPKIQSLEDYRPDVITDIYSDDNKVIGEFAVERRIVVPYYHPPARPRAAPPEGKDARS